MKLKLSTPKQVTWWICVGLYAFALLSQLGVLRIGGGLPSFAWIVGYGLLLVACAIRGL
jgi:hypothetical protein